VKTVANIQVGAFVLLPVNHKKKVLLVQEPKN
jgi:hypothetical protein